jgi:hypothetical protein
MGLRRVLLAVVGVCALALPSAEVGAATMDAPTGASRMMRVPVPDGGLARLAMPARMIAFTWPQARTASVMFRLRGTDGTWGEWQTAEGEVGGSEEDLAGSDALLQDTSFDQVEVAAGASEHITVLAASIGSAARTSDPAMASAAAVSTPGVHPRSEWGAAGWACTRSPTASARLDTIVVHHTVIFPGNDYPPEQVPDILRFVQHLHLSKGACDVEYNALIDRFGRIWEGRAGGIARVIEGGHTAGFGHNNWGIALIGQHEPDPESGPVEGRPPGAPPSPEAFGALTQLIAWKAALHGLDPLGVVTITSSGNHKFAAGESVTVPTVLGHRDLQATACPGVYMWALIPGLRLDAAAIVEDSRLASAPLIVPREIMRLYRAAFLRRADTAGVQYWWNQIGSGHADLVGVAQLFTDSDEFRGRYGALDNRSFVRQIYRNVLGREPDAGGEGYWTRLLDSMALTRGSVLAGFSRSPELHALTHVRIEVQVAYLDILGRIPTTEEIDAGADELYNGLSYRALIREIYASVHPA